MFSAIRSMNKRTLLMHREPQVEAILLRQLSNHGYRVYPKMALSDVIGKDRGEFLPQRDFEYLCRAHLDFVVAKEHQPIFAVEFDGALHLTDPDTRSRDVIKNRLCRDAELPLLRISGAEIVPDERLTLLDYIVMRHVAWCNEIDGIDSDIREFVEALGSNATFDNLELQCDAGFQFDLKHPYPGSLAVLDRLWRDYRLAWEGDEFERCREASYLCTVQLFRFDGDFRDGYHTCEMIPRVWRNGKPAVAMFESAVRVSVREWLPVALHVPSQGAVIVGPGAVSLGEAMRQLDERVRAVWQPRIPGADPINIAENYARHKGFRAIEQWAGGNLEEFGSRHFVGS